MDPYDKEKTREIWKRVLGEEESCDDRAFDSETLRGMIGSEKELSCMYRNINRCMAGKYRDDFRELAKDAAVYGKKLETIYFIWTGECACVMPGEIPKIGCIADYLRELYRREMETAARLRRTSEELPDYAACLIAMAQAKSCRAEKLIRVLTCYV